MKYLVRTLEVLLFIPVVFSLPIIFAALLVLGFISYPIIYIIFGNKTLIEDIVYFLSDSIDYIMLYVHRIYDWLERKGWK